MMLLRSSPASPFVRKVRISAAVLGLSERIALEDADTMNPDQQLVAQNPLGKIPALLLENGETLYDSRVIVEFLDMLAGGGRIIPAGWGRVEPLRQQALADGIMDSGVIQMYEIRWRPEERREAKWVEHQTGKVDRALAIAEATLSTAATTLHIGHIALACALGYLDLRFEGRWRETCPRLVAWLDDFAERVPAFEETRMKK